MHSIPLLRRGVAWAMLALYCLVASGLPLPMVMPPAGSAAAKRIAGKDRSQPFPCMDKACGCDSAERCFSSCCCHTPSETLAWAEARGIDAAVIDALTRRVATGPATPEPSASSCCSSTDETASETGSCCSVDVDDPDQAICSDYQSLAAEARTTTCGDAVPEPPIEDEAPKDSPTTPRVVVLRAMLACGGIVAQWTSMGTSLPPPAIVTCDLPWPQVDVLAVDDARVIGAGTPPDLPPPRCC